MEKKIPAGVRCMSTSVARAEVLSVCVCSGGAWEY